MHSVTLGSTTATMSQPGFSMKAGVNLTNMWMHAPSSYQSKAAAASAYHAKSISPLPTKHPPDAPTLIPGAARNNDDAETTKSRGGSQFAQHDRAHVPEIIMPVCEIMIHDTSKASEKPPPPAHRCIGTKNNNQDLVAAARSKAGSLYCCCSVDRDNMLQTGSNCICVGLFVTFEVMTGHNDSLHAVHQLLMVFMPMMGMYIGWHCSRPLLENMRYVTIPSGMLCMVLFSVLFVMDCAALTPAASPTSTTQYIDAAANSRHSINSQRHDHMLYVSQRCLQAFSLVSASVYVCSHILNGRNTIVVSCLLVLQALLSMLAAVMQDNQVALVVWGSVLICTAVGA